MKMGLRILTIVLLLCGVAVAAAFKSRKTTNQFNSITTSFTALQTPNAAFNSFWKTFKAAMAKNDKEAVADLTKLPFLYDSRERDRAGFLKIYDQFFTRKVRRCVATAKLVKEQDSYEIFCGELILIFGKDSDGKYKFLEFGVND